jgi:hypothetical protein
MTTSSRQRSVFGEWYSDYQERKQKQQEQQQQQQQQSTSTNRGGNITVTATLTANTIHNAADLAATSAKTTVVNVDGALAESQARQAATTTAATSSSRNDLSRQSTDKNKDGQAVIVVGSQSLLSSEQNESGTTATADAAAVYQQSTRSTTGPFNTSAAGSFQPPTAATDEERGSRTGENAPPVNGQQRTEGMSSPRKRQRTMTHYSPLVSFLFCDAKYKTSDTLSPSYHIYIMYVCLMLNRNK